LKVLLVEDDDAVAASVGEMLSALGHQSERAANADAALIRLDAGATFDVVLSDMVMPGVLGGIGLAREVRRRFPGLPIVLTTGYSAAAEQAIREGLTPLAKPYAIDALAARLDNAASPARNDAKNTG
jgi:DNA-binding NtrC family response regulator